MLATASYSNELTFILERSNVYAPCIFIITY